MAKKDNKRKPELKKVTDAPKPGNLLANDNMPNGQDKPGFMSKYANLLYASGIGFIIFLFFKVCLENQFVNWDDPGYVTENQLITSLTGTNIRHIFSTPVMGNYHPLTMLSLAIEYSYVQLAPFLYHLDSLLLHIIVSVLVYWLVFLLTKRPLAAAITALLFGLHPMHVESVAWVSARKDVLYGAFYIAALITYVYYKRNLGARKWGLYSLALILFICSLLSKPVAVILPISMLLIDYFEKRKMDLTSWLEKVPFFMLALGFGIRSVYDQKELGVVTKLNDHFNLIDTITMGCYTFGSYLWKAILPIGLSCFYPYPPKVNGFFPAQFYVYPFAVGALLFVLWKFARNNRGIVFGFLFFAANIALLLQFLPVGNAIIADRYSYIPYLGLFFIVGYVVASFVDKTTQPGMKKLLPAAIFLCCAVLGGIGNARCNTWHDSTTLWMDQMKKHPDNEYAYNSIGFDYFTRWKTARSAEEEKMLYDSAQYYLNAAVKINPNYPNPYLSLGIMARTMKNFDEARRDFYTAAKLSNSTDAAKAYLGLGLVYFVTQQIDSSGYYLRKAISISPNLQAAHANYANLLDMTDHTDDALKEYSLSIALAPSAYESYLNRGRLLMRLNKDNEASRDFNKAIELNPESGEAYYTRALYYGKTGQKNLALDDLQTAATYGYNKVDKTFYESLTK